jgi:diguanylate cyclase (GGDEF)-like protein
MHASPSTAPAPPHRELPLARRSGDPTTGLIRRVLLACLGLGAVAVVAVLVLRWDDALLRGVSPFLLAVVLLFGWLVLRRPEATVVVSRLVLAGLDTLWLAVMAARLLSSADGWAALFPTTFMGFALFVVIGYLVYPTRFAVLHAGALVALAVVAGLVGLLRGPRTAATGDHVVDLLRYAVYLAVLAAMVWVLSRTKEHAARAFLVAEVASAEAASMREIASRDPLTGAANRRRLEDEIAYQARVVGSGLPVALVFLDLDRFKAVNDLHGHAVGDRVLVAVARALEGQVRSGDLVARLGGEEFLVVAPGMAVADGAVLAERLRAAVPVAVRRVVPVDVTASLGVTALRPGEDPRAAIARVDALMYRAKRAGRDRVEVEPDEPGHAGRADHAGPADHADHPDHAGHAADVQPASSRTGQEGGSAAPGSAR